MRDAISAAPADERGRAPEPRPGIRSGRAPGSANVPFHDLLDPELKTLVAPAEIRRRFAEAGVDIGEEGAGGEGSGEGTGSGSGGGGATAARAGRKYEPSSEGATGCARNARHAESSFSLASCVCWRRLSSAARRVFDVGACALSPTFSAARAWRA